MDGALAPSPAARPETHQAPAPVDAALAEAPLAFSICTLVNDPAHYAAMRESFARHGFGPGTAEYLYLDNSAGPRWCAFRGIPRLLAAARGRHVILCHQDVRLEREGAEVLAARLAELDRLDPDWAVAGNAGATPEGGLALRISDPHGEDQRRGELPARVVSLDENFLVLRRDAPVGLSADLAGFHLYGADLCLHARLAGRSAWVIDFHLRHLSPGRVDGGFVAAQARFEAKFAALLGRPWRIRTTCTELRLEAGRLGRWWAARRLRRRMRRLAS